MNPLIQLKTTPPLLITLTLLCFGLLPKAQAVVPSPDGCYPGLTTAEGCLAVQNLTTGTGNTGVGWRALFSAGASNFNTGVGAGALVLNTGDSNTAVGAAALLLNTTGSNNTANGFEALFSNTTGDGNTATGYGALVNNTTGSADTASGVGALYRNTTGFGNTAIGSGALSLNTTSDGNTAVGGSALLNTTGSGNTALGIAAGGVSTGNDNTALGNNAGSNVSTANNVIVIGANLAGADVSNTCFIGNIFGVTTAIPDAIPVVIDSVGQLGTMSSSVRFKKEIKPMEKDSEAILSLKPVTFHYKSDTKGMPQFGLIAEEVAKVNPDLVVRDNDGEIYTVRYEAVNAMLLNEFLKEHRKVEKLEAALRTVNERLAKQAAEIQKVSAQLEASKPAPQVVLTNR
ncbi:MAG: tail fiber domain-containing protein [Candidatus Udaeobacter sp.]